MGIVYALLKGIPVNQHLDSFELLSNKTRTEITLEEFLELERKKWEEIRAGENGNFPKGRPVIEQGKKWNGFFTDAKKAVLEAIAFSGEAYVHVRGRYDRLSPEVAVEFESRLLKDFIHDDWETILRFASDVVSKNEPVGLISILQHPGLSPMTHQNARDIFNRLVPRAACLTGSEIVVVYSKGNFARQFPFEETESGVVIADRSKIPSQAYYGHGGNSPRPKTLIDRYSVVMPPKEDCMFFSFTTYNNSLLGDAKEILPEPAESSKL